LKKSDWIFILVAGSVIGVLVVLSLMGRKAAPVSAIPQHAGLTAESTRAECMSCHDPVREGASAPLPASHPQVWKKEQVSCTSCHAAQALARSAQTASQGPTPVEETQRQ
jgi:hypothetical protein